MAERITYALEFHSIRTDCIGQKRIAVYVTGAGSNGEATALSHSDPFYQFRLDYRLPDAKDPGFEYFAFEYEFGSTGVRARDAERMAQGFAKFERARARAEALTYTTNHDVFAALFQMAHALKVKAFYVWSDRAGDYVAHDLQGFMSRLQHTVGQYKASIAPASAAA